jgi:hypothetical protein
VAIEAEASAKLMSSQHFLGFLALFRCMHATKKTLSRRPELTHWQTRSAPRCSQAHKNSIDPAPNVGIIDNTQAVLITRFKNVNPDGSLLELVVWKVPQPVPPTEHGYKYRAVFVVDGRRVVGFDNERGKGDHCHFGDEERPYAFISVEQLVEDFIAAVAARRTR